MSQFEIMQFLDANKGVYYNTNQINEATNCNLRNTYRSLKKVIRREEYSMIIIPNDKKGRGSNIQMLYAYSPKEE